MSSNNVSEYYSRFGSWAGYNLVMGRSQHAGYWKKDTKNEKEAQKNFLSELVSLLKLKKSDKVLDAGSGQGYAARHLADTTNADITGITITPREVSISRKLSASDKNPPTYVLGDYSKTSFPDECFDVIYSIETLSHSRNIQKAMDEFYRILKPGGKIYLVDYEVDTRELSKYKKEVIDFLVTYAGGYGLYSQKPGEISSYMKNAKFRNLKKLDWTKNTKPTFDRLRRIAKPFSWISPRSFLAQYFVNAVMATHFYSNWYEDGSFRYIVYCGEKNK